MQIITADERSTRATRRQGADRGSDRRRQDQSLLRTLDPARTLFLDVEAGDLSVLDLPVPTVRVDDWPSCA